ncbi:uncharacterized protein BDV17DRAFT_291405 [Aspergillus undulatus]|uniref:uncharacterized protein n=1 Tax=Aspergillus undulatus TaxID=1810928 RepID=UPI003CCDB2CF
MCQHTCQNHRACGHIASFTLDACTDLTDAIRTKSLLPRPAYPIQIKRETFKSSQYSQDIHCMRCCATATTPGTDNASSNSSPLDTITCKSNNGSAPVLTADFTMIFPSTQGVGQDKIMYRVQAGAAIGTDDGSGLHLEGSDETSAASRTEPSVIPPEFLDAKEDDCDAGSEGGDDEDWAGTDTGDEYDMCYFEDPISHLGTSCSGILVPSPSEDGNGYESADEAEGQLAYRRLASLSSAASLQLLPHSPREEFWTSNRTRMQSPAPGFDGRDDYFAELGLGANDLTCNSVVDVVTESGDQWGLLQGLQMLFPSYFNTNQQPVWGTC